MIMSSSCDLQFKVQASSAAISTSQLDDWIEERKNDLSNLGELCKLLAVENAELKRKNHLLKQLATTNTVIGNRRNISSNGISEVHYGDGSQSPNAIVNRSSDVEVRNFSVEVSPDLCCPVCQRTVKSKKSLDEHIQVHLRTLRFECEFCGKTFLNKQMKVQHTATHANVKRPTFFKRMWEKTVMKHNISLRRAEQQPSIIDQRSHSHTCELCGQVFYDINEMILHICKEHKQARNEGQSAEKRRPHFM